jgi:RNA polymerase sigma factor (sigma-70 family)
MSGFRKADRQSQSLIRRSQRDAAAFVEVYEAYSERLLLFLSRKVLDVEVAFDLHAELFAVALERRHQFRGRTVAEDEGWLYAIARNELSHYWRGGAVERRAMERLRLTRPELDDAAIERIEELATLADLAPQITAALDTLPAEQREAVRLRIIEELSYEEIAVQVAVSKDTVRARVSRGLRALAAQIRTDDEAVGEPA